MKSFTKLVASLVTAWALSGCALADFSLQPLLPSLLGGSPSGDEAAESGAAGEAAGAPQAQSLGRLSAAQASGIQPVALRESAPTGTAVGARAARLADDLRRLEGDIRTQNQAIQAVRAEIARNAQSYNGLVGTIQSRLQVGSTPGNPELEANWRDAQQVLDSVAREISQMNEIVSAVADQSALADFILESTRATLLISGAVEEDHRRLRILEDEIARTTVLIDRLLAGANEDIARQSNFVGRERNNLSTLRAAVASGELLGPSPANRVIFRDSQQVVARTIDADRRPLVIIRFTKPDVDYEQPVFRAISEALNRRASASFDILAVSPTQGTPAQIAQAANEARRNAQRVMQSLISMGVPAERLALSATTSDTVQANEVRIYVR